MPRKKILLVEDEPIIAMNIRQSLEAEGHCVVAVVSSGDEAFHVLSEQAPDLILMDIHLEGSIDGIETAETVRKQFRIPILFLTGQLSAEHQTIIQRKSYYRFLKKPFTNQQMLEAISSFPK